MNESEWPTSTDPQAMLTFLQGSGRASDRKLRLFACGCARRAWHLLDHAWSRKAIETAERFADLEATPRQLDSWFNRSLKAIPATGPKEMHAASAAHAAVERHQFNLVLGVIHHAIAALGVGERDVQRRLARCVFGNPFRPPLPLTPSLLECQTGLIMRMANAIYEERSLPSGHLDAARLAVLADALEDAGCSQDREVLLHLRGSGDHVRGCFAVDLLLNRQ
jgi:hypothetical protein